MNPDFDQGYATGKAAYRRGDYSAAHRCLLPIAQQGHPHAQCILGAMYYVGQGSAQDFCAAAHWYRKAAEQGIVEAQYLLGRMLMGGQGICRDTQAGLMWLERALVLNHYGAALEIIQMAPQGMRDLTRSWSAGRALGWTFLLQYLLLASLDPRLITGQWLFEILGVPWLLAAIYLFWAKDKIHKSHVFSQARRVIGQQRAAHAAWLNAYQAESIITPSSQKAAGPGSPEPPPEWGARRPPPGVGVNDMSSYWPEILGVSPDAPAAEVRRAYQVRISEYHPDKVAHLGAALRNLAHEKTKEINAAYCYLKDIGRV